MIKAGNINLQRQNPPKMVSAAGLTVGKIRESGVGTVRYPLKTKSKGEYGSQIAKWCVRTKRPQGSGSMGLELGVTFKGLMLVVLANNHRHLKTKRRGLGQTLPMKRKDRSHIPFTKLRPGSHVTRRGARFTTDPIEIPKTLNCATYLKRQF